MDEPSALAKHYGKCGFSLLFYLNRWTAIVEPMRQTLVPARRGPAADHLQGGVVKVRLLTLP